VVLREPRLAQALASRGGEGAVAPGAQASTASVRLASLSSSDR
jgi:hypothetical protein